MEDTGAVESAPAIFKVLTNDICRRTIFDYVPIKDLMHSETVSKSWQEVLHGYTNNDLALTLNIWKSRRLLVGPKHRAVSVLPHEYTKIIDKLRRLTVGVLTDRDEIIEELGSKCPRLKSLGLIACDSVVFQRLLSTSFLHKIKNLELDRMPIKTLTKVHLLLDKMPSVESVTLRSCSLVGDEYNHEYNYNANIQEHLSKEFIGCFSRLVHLRRLKMQLVLYESDTDALLEALAGCKRLERLEMSGDQLTKCGRGWAALIRRLRAATTTIHFVQDVSTKEKKNLIKDLEVHGCREMIEDFSESRHSRQHILPLEFKIRSPNVEDINSQSKLKITIDSIRFNDDIEPQDYLPTVEPRGGFHNFF